MERGESRPLAGSAWCRRPRFPPCRESCGEGRHRRTAKAELPGLHGGGRKARRLAGRCDSEGGRGAADPEEPELRHPSHGRGGNLFPLPGAQLPRLSDGNDNALGVASALYTAFLPPSAREGRWARELSLLPAPGNQNGIKWDTAVSPGGWMDQRPPSGNGTCARQTRHTAPGLQVGKPTGRPENDPSPKMPHDPGM